MSVEKNYQFLIPGNYSYNPEEIEISLGCRLALQQDDLDFSENFLSSLGLVFDIDKIEWIGDPNYIIRQKDTRPSNALLYASFSTNQNSDYGIGSLVNGLSGGATWIDGQIDLTGVSGKRLNMPGADGNFDIVGSSGCIRFSYTPNYGVLVGIVQILEYNAVNANNNMIQIYQNGSSLIVDLRDSSGAQHLLIGSIGNLTQGQKYVFELNFDFDGVSRFFVDGVQISSLNTSSWDRIPESGTFKWGGATGLGNFWLDDVILFDAVQHTVNHAEEFPFIYNTSIYVEGTVILPEMEHIGDGTIKLFNSFSVVESGDPRYIIQIGRSGNYLYWDGAGWVVSDETYSQANEAAVFNANCQSLPVDGEIYGQFMVLFPYSNDLSSVSLIITNMNVDIGYLTGNPSIILNDLFRHEGIDGFSESAFKGGSDEIRYILKKMDLEYWWDGAGWVVSDGTYAQANSANVILDNISSFTDSIVDTQIKMFLHSEDGSSTPKITNLKINYDFAGSTPDEIELCIVWWYMFNSNGNPVQDVVFISLNKDSVRYKDGIAIQSSKIEVTPDEQGYCEIELVETENMEDGARYIFSFGKEKFERQIPNEQNKNFWDLIE